MDKDTLSAYGWILIATIAIGVFFALSQPIGQYVGEVVTGVGQGMVDVGDSVGKLKHLPFHCSGISATGVV